MSAPMHQDGLHWGPSLPSQILTSSCLRNRMHHQLFKLNMGTPIEFFHYFYYGFLPSLPPFSPLSFTHYFYKYYLFYPVPYCISIIFDYYFAQMLYLSSENKTMTSWGEATHMTQQTNHDWVHSHHFSYMCLSLTFVPAPPEEVWITKTFGDPFLYFLLIF